MATSLQGATSRSRLEESTVWGSNVLTWVESNQFHLIPLRGELPCNNNALEAGNAANKESLVYEDFIL